VLASGDRASANCGPGQTVGSGETRRAGGDRLGKLVKEQPDVSTGQLAELIAAGFFAVGVCAAVYVMARLARLITTATAAVADYRERADSVLGQAQAAVDRASQQLARTDAITASMDDVTANMAELSGHVSAMAGLARSISGGFGAPLLRVAAVAYGIRRAAGLRLGGGRSAARTALPAKSGPAISPAEGAHR
jgi:hypothetical protein